MKKNRRKKHKINKKSQLQEPRPQSAQIPNTKNYISKIVKITGLVFASVCSVLTLVCAYFQFQPLVSVNPETSLNPKNAFSTPFDICNESPFSIYKISNNYTVNRIEAEQGLKVFGATWMDANAAPVPELRPKESTPMMIDWHFSNKPISCDVTINVIYRPAFLWWEKKQTFRFFTDTNSEGQIVWYRRAQSEPGTKRGDYFVK